MSQIIGPQNRVVRAGSIVAQQTAFLYRQRRGSFLTIPPPPVKTDEPQTTTLGLEVTRSFTLLEARLADGVALYELREGDEVLDDRGLGTVEDALVARQS